MVRAKQHEQQKEEWEKLDDPTVRQKIQRLIQELSNPADYEGLMFVRMGTALPRDLHGEIEPLTLMMEDNLLSDYYNVALGTPQTYPQVTRFVLLQSHKCPNLDYLEIGAGTGGATARVIQALAGYEQHKYPRFHSYTFTDISTSFLEQGSTRFGDLSGQMHFRKLDIEQDPTSQLRFENAQFDVILAANWRDVLQRNGFSDLKASSPDMDDPLEEGTRVMIAAALEQKAPVVQNCSRQGTPAKTSSCTLCDLQHEDLTGTVCISLAEFDDAVLAHISAADF
ncbi:hypothetical protein BJY01DRAFT_256002 [Aspergillus pseudoustus]|uniref:Methyltransferase type 12 domain-containing protein n=1 Tax=Aspergillus pseudoustus TaxID=1810923 RepID=A0ABR4IHQ0_9EURO